MQRRTAVAVLAVCTMSMAGCSSKSDQASDTLPTAVASTASSSPTVTSPSPSTASVTTSPAKPTKQGAVDAALNFVKILDHTQATWDTTELAKVALTSCTTCEEFIRQLPRAKREGYTFRGGRIRVTGKAQLVVYDQPSHEATTIVPTSLSALVVHDPHGKLYYKPGDPIGGGPARPRLTLTVGVRWVGTTWKVFNYTAEIPS